jgi:hypothetical protein
MQVFGGQVNKQQYVWNQTVRLAGVNLACPLAAPNASKGARAPSLAGQISRSGLCFLLGIIFFASLCPMSLHGQGSDGTIEGTIKDSTGAVVPGATVTIRNMDTDVKRTVVTENSGHFNVLALVAGNYEVKAEHSGFQTMTQRGVVLTVSQQEVVNFTLSVGTAPRP